MLKRCLVLVVTLFIGGSEQGWSQPQPVEVRDYRPLRVFGPSDYNFFIDRDDSQWGALFLNVSSSFAGDGDDFALVAVGKDFSLTSLGGDIFLFPAGDGKGRVGIGTTAPGARFHLTSQNLTGMISSVSHSSDWGYGILSEVTRPNTKAFAVVNTSDGEERFTVFGDGKIVSSVGHGSWLELRDKIGGSAYLFHNSPDGNRFEIGIHDGAQYNWGIFTITKEGQIGLGTTKPTERLQVAGRVHIEGSDLILGTKDGRSQGNRPRQRALVHSNVAVGAKFEDTLTINYAGDFEGGVHLNGPRLIVGGDHIVQGDHKNYRLAVDGKVVAKEVVVTLNDWADFVFEPQYELLSLDQVGKFIEEYKHLPGVPSENEVLQQGVNLGEMDAILLSKIEELTLYLLELQGTNQELRSRVEQLEVLIDRDASISGESGGLR